MEGDRFGPPRNLGAPVNGDSGEWGSTLDAAETLLVFESSGRAQNLSESGDLYFSRRIDGAWTEPRHFAAPINSAGSDLAPRWSA